MMINTTYQAVRQMIPSYEQIVEKGSYLASNVARNVNRVALPAIALVVLSNIPGAEAGSKEYWDCMVECNERNLDNFWGLMVCPVACAAALLF